MKNSPDLWQHLLKQMPRGSVVAGGAVRDYLLGVEPKDIDIFCFHDPEDEIPEGFSGISREVSEEYENVSGVQFVWHGTIDGWEIDLVYIALKNVEELLNGFDFGITQCAYDGDHMVVFPTFLIDKATRSVTLLHPLRDRTIARFNRFNARHGGDWSFRK